MMEAKLFEVRDESTHIPCLAVSITRKDGYPAARASFDDERYIILTKLNDCKSQHDPFGWPASHGRTMQVVHNYILASWDKLKNEDVIDVRYILGITHAPVPSEKGLIHDLPI